MRNKAFYLQFVLFCLALLHYGSASIIVRLNGTNSSSSEGRVEVRYRGVWGTICDDHWSLDNAHVVCRMLGFARAFINKRFAPGTGKIWLDDVQCIGTETSIDECRHSGWGNHDCMHSEDIGVVCTNSSPNITVRLADSSLSHAGQIEIRYFGIWRPVCDTYWSLQAAHVVCRMFNYTDGAALSLQGFQGTSGAAWGTRISCKGNEISISKCKLIYWGESDCSSHYRAGVVCLGKGQSPNIAVRLVNGSTPNQGRVEVRYYGVWGTVCDDYWGIGNAHVICHMMNYSKALTTGQASIAGSGPILLDDVWCSGFENSLENCLKQPWGRHNCRHFEDVGVTCAIGPRAYPNISVRLLNSSLPYAGQIEVRYYGVWKPVCDRRWARSEAHVACKMMGFSLGAALPLRGYESTTGAGAAWDTNMVCRGSETSLDKCVHYYWTQSSCQNSHRAGVVCLRTGEDSNAAVRLVDGNTPNQGRVEVRYYGVWGTVCDDYWGISEAHVVCRMLNYSRALKTGTSSKPGSGAILLDNVYCNGYENSLESCWNVGWGQHNCDHSEDVYVMCANETKVQTPDVAVRLVSGSTPNQGRVEVRYYGVWGTVCDDHWDLADAYVICRMLNYSKASWTGNAKSSGNGPIALDNVRCRGNEKSIEYCSKSQWGWHNCYHLEDAGVKCEHLSPEESKIAARLVGTNYKHMGFVEVNYNGTWRPVCYDTWDISDAHVVCRMLGYKGALIGIKGYGVRKEPSLWMGNVECSGDEKKISECYHRGWTNTLCPGKQYAGVVCINTNGFAPVRIRLENGSTTNNGRVAIGLGNLWGTVCSKILDDNAATVMCRMLGYPGSHYTYSFKPGSGAIWTVNLVCGGTETSIFDCSYGWGNATCSGHENDVAIMCKKAAAPGFQIKGTSAITDSTVVIVFKETQPSIGARLKSVYQVAVEKINLEKIYQSHGQTVPSVFTEETNKFNNSYMTAKIPGSSPSLTIGDGLSYNGFYNAPLEPGCRYRVYVRAVTRTVDKKPIYSDTAFVAFTTKSQPIPKGTSKDQMKRSNFEAGLIVLSLIIFVLILMIILYFGWRYLKKKRETQDKSVILDNPLAVSSTGNEPSAPRHQAQSYPSGQGQAGDTKTNTIDAILNKLNRKKSPERFRTSMALERSDPSDHHSSSFPTDFGGIENQGFGISFRRLQELNSSQTDQEI